MKSTGFNFLTGISACIVGYGCLIKSLDIVETAKTPFHLVKGATVFGVGWLNVYSMYLLIKTDDI